MKQEIQNILKNRDPKSYYRLLAKHQDIFDWIIANTDQYSPKNFNERVYIILVGAPKKQNCGKYPAFSSYQKGYRNFCGSKNTCACNRTQHSKKLETFHQTNSKENKKQTLEKMQETCLSRYGVKNPAQDQKIREKIHKTNMQKYGAATPLESDQILSKIKNTNLKRYDVDCPFQNSQIIEKSHKTLKSRYGDDFMKLARQSFLKQNNNQNPFVVHQEKIKKSMLKNWGVDHPSKSKLIIENKKQKELKKYNVSNPSQRHWTPGVYNILTNKDQFQDFIHNKSFAECLDFLKIDDKTLWAYHDYHNSNVFKKSPRSKYEEEIAHWLDSLTVNYTRNSKIRNNKTVDFLIENKIAIEFNGLYTHSINSHYGKMLGVDRNYHYNKFLSCQQDCIFLYTIFEDEWLSNKNAFKNKIKSSLGLTPKGDSARKCTLKYINSDVARNFLNTYHIQGSANGSCYLGSYDSHNALVAVMVFKKTKDSVYELNRFANDHYTHAGLFTRMLNKFQKDYKPTKIISFSDNRYSNGNVYKNNGFELDYQLPPGYSVTNYKIREHKFNWRKNRIASRFNIDITGKTEWQLTQELGWDRIWDCGKIRWIKK